MAKKQYQETVCTAARVKINNIFRHAYPGGFQFRILGVHGVDDQFVHDCLRTVQGDEI
jgi:hypothetical protein